MQLSADQELRRELLLVSLSKQSDLEGAINLAAQMEQFVLRGSCTKSAAVEKLAGSAANGTEHSPGSTDSGYTRLEIRSLPEIRPIGREMNGSAGVQAAANGSPSGSHNSAGSSAAAGGQKRRWSSGDDERLRRLWRSDHSLEEIAEAMGRTTPSLYSRARALGMSKRSPTVSNQEAARSNRGARESGSGEAAPSSDSEDDISGKAGQRAQITTSKARTAEYEIKRYSSPCSGSRESVKLANDFGQNTHHRRARSPACHSFQTVLLEAGVEPIVHFLRSRDYSVVRVEDGRFRVDGRHVLDADELREKANKVRQSLGKPPFAPQSYEVAE